MMLCERCGQARIRACQSRFCTAKDCHGRLKRVARSKRWKARSFDEATSEIVKASRWERGLSASAVSKRCGLSKGFLSDVENGKRGISLENWVRLMVDGIGRSATLALSDVIAAIQGKKGKAK